MPVSDSTTLAESPVGPDATPTAPVDPDATSATDTGPAIVPSPPARETIHHPGADALDLAQILRTVGDPLRLAMVRDLAAHDELLCGALGERLGLPKSTGSYHLRLLREAGLTRTRQEGTLRFVSLRRADLETRFPGLVDVLAAGERG